MKTFFNKYLLSTFSLVFFLALFCHHISFAVGGNVADQKTVSKIESAGSMDAAASQLSNNLVSAENLLVDITKKLNIQESDISVLEKKIAELAKRKRLPRYILDFPACRLLRAVLRPVVRFFFRKMGHRVFAQRLVDLYRHVTRR